VVTEQRLKSGEVAVDDGLYSRLEPEDRAIDADGVGVFLESRPVRKRIPAREREPRVVEVEGRLLDVGAGHEFRPPRDRLVQKARVVLVNDPNRVGGPGAMSLEQFAGLSFVVLELRAKRQRFHRAQVAHSTLTTRRQARPIEGRLSGAGARVHGVKMVRSVRSSRTAVRRTRASSP
jgi:hypothetical protein